METSSASGTEISFRSSTRTAIPSHGKPLGFLFERASRFATAWKEIAISFCTWNSGIRFFTGFPRACKFIWSDKLWNTARKLFDQPQIIPEFSKDIPTSFLHRGKRGFCIKVKISRLRFITPWLGRKFYLSRRSRTASFAIFWAKKNGGSLFFRSPAILKRFLSLKTQKFAVKWNCKNRFTLVKKNSESLQGYHQDCNRIETMIH